MSRTLIRLQVRPTGNVVRTTATQVKANLALLMANPNAETRTPDLPATRPCVGHGPQPETQARHGIAQECSSNLVQRRSLDEVIGESRLPSGCGTL